MKQRGKMPSMKTARASTRRNWQLMILLELVLEFQKEVSKVRAQFGIPLQGMITDHEKNALRYEYNEAEEYKINREADKKLSSLGEFFTYPLAFGTEPEEKPFQKEIIRIGEKFGLPYNLYSGSMYGVSWYILRNRISVPESNWNLETDLDNRWVGIRAYSALDKKEAEEAIAELNRELSKGKRRRMKTDTERNLFEVVELITSKQENINDRVPSNAKQRSLMTRKNKLAKELFGYGLER